MDLEPANTCALLQNHENSQDFLWWTKPEMGQFLDSVNRRALNQKCFARKISKNHEFEAKFLEKVAVQVPWENIDIASRPNH